MTENKDDDSLESAEPKIEDDSEESSVRHGRTTAELTVKETFEFSGPLPPLNFSKVTKKRLGVAPNAS
jgi:hypothetical protein